MGQTLTQECLLGGGGGGEISVARLCGHAGPSKACTAVQLWKRNVVIRDDSGSSVEITFWGGYAQDPGDMLQEVCIYLTLQSEAVDIPLTSASKGICSSRTRSEACTAATSSSAP